MKDAEFINLGVIEYAKAWDTQKHVFQKLIDAKVSGEKTEQKIFFCEHPHVYTLGRFGKRANFLVDDEFLKKIDASYFETDRGGDITYHGYGQIVCYPILNLENYNISLKEYIHRLEEVVIKTLAEYGIKTERLESATGVWIDTDKPQTRKICAIGVKASRFVTMHGLALNINTDLDYYNYINPCGFTDKGVTSLLKETGVNHPLNEIITVMQKHFSNIFQ